MEESTIIENAVNINDFIDVKYDSWEDLIFTEGENIKYLTINQLRAKGLKCELVRNKKKSFYVTKEGVIKVIKPETDLILFGTLNYNQWDEDEKVDKRVFEFNNGKYNIADCIVAKTGKYIELNFDLAELYYVENKNS